MKYYYGLPFVAVLCIIVLVAVVAVRRFGPTARNMPVLEQRTDAIIMGTVTPGTEVIIQKVQLSKPGFVVLHSSEGGIPGDIITMSELLPVGETENTTLTIEGGIKTGEEYVVMLHGDDGNDVYDDPVADAPITIANGIVQQIVTVTNE